ncbi:cell agglutination protein Mam3 [Umbelopsis nana]
MPLSPRKRVRTDDQEDSVTVLSKPYRASELAKALEHGDERRIETLRQQLALSTDEELWTFLRRILRNFKADQDPQARPTMPMGKVLECLHFVVMSLTHRPRSQQPVSAAAAGIVPSTRSDTETLRACVRKAVQNIKGGSQSNQIFALKLLCAFVEDQKAAAYTHPAPMSLVVDEIRRTSAVDHVLESLAQETQNVQHYALRALMPLTSVFGKEMVEKDAMWTVAARLGGLQQLLTREMRLPEKQREKTWSGKLHICMLAGSLARRLVQIAEASNANKLREFGSSVAFSTVLKVWPIAVWESTQDSNILGLGRLIASVSSIVYKIAVASKEATDRIRSEPRFADCYHITLLQYTTIMQTEPHKLYLEQLPVKRSSSPGQKVDYTSLEETLQTISRIVIHVFDAPSSIRLSHAVVIQILVDTLNFLVVLLWHPIVPEDFEYMTQKEQIPNNAIKTLEEIMKPSFGVYIQKKPNIIKSALDILFRYLQLCDDSRTRELCIPTALCLRHITLVVTMESSEVYESIISRAQRLAELLLYYPEGVQYLSQNISPSASALFWHPIIEHAKLALRELLDFDMNVVADTTLRTKTIARGKRALHTLVKASHINEACAKIVEVGVLTIMDPFFPPRTAYIETKDGRFLCSQMAELLYHLAKDMALVRGKFRQEHQGIPCILHILCQSLRKMQQAGAAGSTALQGMERLQRNCLQVVSAFRFDRAGLQDWVKYPVSEELMAHIDQYSEAAISNRSELSVTPIILKMLFPIVPDEQSVTYRSEPPTLSQVTTQSQSTILIALSALEPLSLVPTALRQMMVYPKAVRWLSQLLLSGSVLSVEADTDTFPSAVIENSNSSVSQLLETVSDMGQVACSSDTASDDDEQPSLSQHESSNALASDHTTAHWVQILHQSLGRAISLKDSLQWFVIQDLYTDLFGPWMLSGSTRDEPMRSLVSSFRSKARSKTLPDLIRLFNYAKYNDEAIRLLEFTSVAICYAIPPPPDRTQILSLLEEDYLNSSSVFGVICRMFFCELEPLDERLESANEQDQETLQRRTAAGQAIQILMLDTEPWHEQVSTTADSLPTPTIRTVSSSETSEIVYLATEDTSTPFSASRALLVASSPTFQALLSDQYQEATQDTILLRGVKGDDLAALLGAIERSQHPDQTIIHPDMAWDIVVGLLLISDRYVVDAVTYACQKWMLKRFAMQTPSDETLDGAMLTYRLCRDPTSVLPEPSWPHSLVTHAAVKTILSSMVRVTQTRQFSAMVEGVGGQEDANEIDSFCSAMAKTLRVE